MSSSSSSSLSGGTDDRSFSFVSSFFISGRRGRSSVFSVDFELDTEEEEEEE